MAHDRTPAERNRPQRVDARDNAQRILEVARAAFLSGASPSLEDIAAAADVGVATLYRHFSNREALVRAVYHEVFADLIVPQMSPENVLGSFRHAFIYLSVEVIDLLSAAPTSNLAELAAELVHVNIDFYRVVLEGAQQQGDIRPDIGIEDVPHILVMLVVGLSTPELNDAGRARYLALMFDALRPGHPDELPPRP